MSLDIQGNSTSQVHLVNEFLTKTISLRQRGRLIDQFGNPHYRYTLHSRLVPLFKDAGRRERRGTGGGSWGGGFHGGCRRQWLMCRKIVAKRT